MLGHAPTSTRAYLKAATQQAHTRAERRWAGPDGFADLPAYRDWLTALLGLHGTMGLQAAAILRPWCDPQVERDRVQALSRDLGLADVPRAASPGAQSESWAWGVQYVLNGSALGASILLKSGGVEPAWPAHYLSAMQKYASSGQLKSFFSTLDARAVDLPQARRAAEDAFAALSAHA